MPDAPLLDEDDPSPLPAGSRNYVTPQGLAALQDEYMQLHGTTRPQIVELVSWAASNGDRSENADYHYGKKRLREIDRRLRYLGGQIKSALPVDPAAQPNRAQIFFGAVVTYCDDAGALRVVHIVGIDEADICVGKISWVSPVARALMKARVGDAVAVPTPAGVAELEIIAIEYPARLE